MTESPLFLGTRGSDPILAAPWQHGAVVFSFAPAHPHLGHFLAMKHIRISVPHAVMLGILVRTSTPSHAFIAL